jgi:integrase
MTRRKNPFPGVTRAVDRHGKVRWRFRKHGHASIYLPGPYGSAEFRAAYEAAREGVKTPAPRSNAAFGSLAWLIEHYLRSARYLNLSDTRRAETRRELEWLRSVAGQYQINRLATRHVEAIMAKKSGPTAANKVKKNLSILFNFAIKHELAGQKHNPARHADRRKESPDGYHTWTDGEILQFLAFHGQGTKARLAALLILNTGAARQDLVRLGWQNVRDGRIRYQRQKTGVGGDYEIMPELAEELRLVPADQLLFLTHQRGRPYTVESFGNWFKDQCKAAGLPHCSAHGLRKGQATRIANAGGSELEIMSFLAHASPKEGATYVKKASRSRLADTALARAASPKPERNVSNLTERLGKTTTQGAEKQWKK